MIATLTSKGQVTLPKAIRDKLKLEAGSKLYFHVRPDGSLNARVLNGSIDSIIGMLHRPGAKAATVEEIDESIAAYVGEEDARIVREARARARPRRAA